MNLKNQQNNQTKNKAAQWLRAAQVALESGSAWAKTLQTKEAK